MPALPALAAALVLAAQPAGGAARDPSRDRLEKLEAELSRDRRGPRGLVPPHSVPARHHVRIQPAARGIAQRRQAGQLGLVVRLGHGFAGQVCTKPNAC